MLKKLKIKTDYHMHSIFSPDGHHSPATLCQTALELGLTEIAITEHAEWHPDGQPQGFPGVAAYFAAIEQCRAEFGPRGLTIHTGVELGNPHQYPAQAAALVNDYPFDVVIGSLHWLYGENIHLESCFANRHPDDVYIDYFIELERMATDVDFDFVAHFDRIIWRGTLLGARFDPWRYESIIRPALAAIARHGKALELNTRFLTHTPNWNKALLTIFHWFLREGGSRVVVNSDAHHIDQIGRNFDLAQQLLILAGYDLPAQLLRVKSTVTDLLSR
ncbi:MAG: histidinol-phosphatase HisJ family protein [Chloroflexota bacterium]